MTAERPEPRPFDVDSFTRDDVIREVARLAALDHRRGIHYWFDAELTESLRDLALGASPSAKQPAARNAPATPDSTPPRPAARPGGSASTPARPTARPGASASTPAPPASSQPSDATAKAPRNPKVPNWGAPPLATGRDADWAERLAALDRRAQACTSCQLCESRNKVVFGVGSSAVPLVFIGEAPGADEDRQGYPFVGRAGQLLDKIIQAIGLERDEIYICNVLKCRPPGNRNPAPDEIAQCTPFLQEQLAILQPKVICTLGLFASQFLLDSQLPIGRLRGQIAAYRGIPVIPTYHPAALLRNPSLKAAVWDDVQLVRRTLDR